MLPTPPIGADHAPAKGPEQQLNRACEACRMSKVRCLVNLVPGSNQCQRCAKVGKSCVFAPPAKRRQRKRTDVRVAELEREVRQMRSLLKTNQISPGDTTNHDSIDEDEDDGDQDDNNSPDVDADSHTSSSTPHRKPDWVFVSKLSKNDSKPKDSLGAHSTDIIERGVITMEQADELLNIYRQKLVEDCFGIPIPAEWTAADLRTKRPALFHAIMAAASHCKGMAISNRLHEEVVYLYARTIFVNGEKSLQCIQALLITITYYTPPNTPQQLQVYQYGNTAASMALELGLGSKPRTHEQLPKRAIKSLQKISSPDELLENCRTILVLYMHTSGFAMRLRRPNILLYNSWMAECATLLEKSPTLNDRRVVASLKLQRISDETMTAFGFDDASTSFSLSELRLQVILKIFERKMADWRNSVPAEVMTTSMMMEFHQNTISMWEFAMDGGQYDAPEFRNRFLSLPALDDDSVQPESLLSRSALQINATIKCIGASHSLLDLFLGLSPEQLQKAPNIFFVRTIFALIALLKADYACGTDIEGLGEMLDSKSLKIDYYFDHAIRNVTEAIGPQKCRLPSHWSFVLKHKIKNWHDEHQTWRKEGKHLKLRADQTAKDQSNSMMQTDEPSTAATALGDVHLHDASTAQSALSTSTSTPPTNHMSNANAHYGMNPSYPNSWVSTGMSMPTQPHNPFASTQSAFSTDITDFSDAFQNGDLYFWNPNDVNQNFGGWVPTQGANMFSDMQFDSTTGGM